MRLELTRAGLLVELANHYTTKGGLGSTCYDPIYESSRDARRVMVIVVGNGLNERNSNPGPDFCISYCALTLGKGTHLTILPSTIGKLSGRLHSLNLVWQPVKKEKILIQTCKTPLINDIVFLYIYNIYIYIYIYIYIFFL